MTQNKGWYKKLSNYSREVIAGNKISNIFAPLFVGKGSFKIRKKA